MQQNATVYLVASVHQTRRGIPFFLKLATADPDFVCPDSYTKITKRFLKNASNLQEKFLNVQ
jgi:hypothetical protein